MRFGYGPQYEVSLATTKCPSLCVTLTDVLHRLLNQSRLLLSSTSRPSFPPLSLYQTFILEEKHGFNKTTPSLYLIDTLKSWGLGFTLGAPFLGAFLFVFKWAGDRLFVISIDNGLPVPNSYPAFL